MVKFLRGVLEVELSVILPRFFFDLTNGWVYAIISLITIKYVGKCPKLGKNSPSQLKKKGGEKVLKLRPSRWQGLALLVFGLLLGPGLVAYGSNIGLAVVTTLGSGLFWAGVLLLVEYKKVK